MNKVQLIKHYKHQIYSLEMGYLTPMQSMLSMNTLFRLETDK